MIVFAAATGLRPSELFGLERRDIDRQLRVVYIRRAYANGRLKHTKTRLSTRAVPLQAKALDALDRLPDSASEILFPNARGGRVDFRSFGRRHWKPAQTAAGIEPLRDLYDLRHTYATTGTSPTTAANTQSLSSTRSFSNGRRTPGGHRRSTRLGRSATATGAPGCGAFVSAWTFRGRRVLSPSQPPKGKERDTQGLREAL